MPLNLHRRHLAAALFLSPLCIPHSTLTTQAGQEAYLLMQRRFKRQLALLFERVSK